MGLATTPRTWVLGETVDQALLNAEVRDAFTGVQAAWDSASWVPGSVWTGATTNPAMGNGSSLGAFHRVGKTVFFTGRIFPGSTTTFGSGAYNIGLPVAASSTAFKVGAAYLVGGGTVNVGACVRTGTGFAVYFHGTNTAWSPTVPLTFASGHQLYFDGSYQCS